MHSGKKWYFLLNPYYVATRSLRSFRSDHYHKYFLVVFSWAKGRRLSSLPVYFISNVRHMPQTQWRLNVHFYWWAMFSWWNTCFAWSFFEECVSFDLLHILLLEPLHNTRVTTVLIPTLDRLVIIKLLHQFFLWPLIFMMTFGLQMDIIIKSVYLLMWLHDEYKNFC